MKFSQTLASHLTPEWRSQYIDYDGLKEILMAALEVSDAPQRQLLELENEFFKKCEENLEKVNRFFAEKLSESFRKNAALKSVIDFYKRRQSTAAKPTWSKRKVKDLLFSYSEHYLNLTLLNNYQNLNLTGFRKILKKHDKIFQNDKGKKWYEKFVLTSEFVKNNDVSLLMEETEQIVTRDLEQGDRSKAMKRLRVPPLHDVTKPVTVFFAGFLMGVSFILLLAGYLGPPIEPEDDFVAHVRLFFPMSCIILYLYFLAGNVFGWRSGGVNHILIFEIDPRNHLTSLEVLQIAGMISLIFTVNLVGFVYWQSINAPRYIFPLIMNGMAFVFIINPLPICYRSTRYWVIISLGRLARAPFAFVRFPDFWIGDQLCSLSSVFVGLFYFICFYARIKNWEYVESSHPCSQEQYLSIYIILKIMPYWFRFAQCIRRYYHLRNSVSLVNAGKYMFSLLASILHVFHTIYMHRYESPLENPYTMAWLIFQMVSTVYSLAYDIIMDWGLFESVHVFLRSQLIYSPKFLYVLACVENSIVRFDWIFFYYIYYVHPISTVLVACLESYFEIFRRFVWNYFRLENEHINNVGLYRAVRDISVQPINMADHRDSR